MPQISALIIANEQAHEVFNAIQHIYESVDEITVIYQNKAEFPKLNHMAGTKTRFYYAPALGLAELYKAYGESLCDNDNIICFDPDERFNPHTLANLPSLFQTKDPVAYRIRRQENKKGTTWQFRIWQKGSLKWKGYVHEHPLILTQKLDLNKDFLLYHIRNPANHPDYNQLLPFQQKSPFKSALKGAGLDMLVNRNISPKRFLSDYQGRRKEWDKLTELDKRVREKVMEEGMARIIGSDSQAGVERLVRQYGEARESGTELLIRILRERVEAMP